MLKIVHAFSPDELVSGSELWSSRVEPTGETWRYEVHLEGLSFTGPRLLPRDDGLVPPVRQVVAHHGAGLFVLLLLWSAPPLWPGRLGWRIAHDCLDKAARIYAPLFVVK